MKLSDLPNIGKELEKKLNHVNISSVEDLDNIGSIEAALKLNEHDEVCSNMLFALEGAIQRVRWHQLDKDYRKQILEEFKTILNK